MIPTIATRRRGIARSADIARWLTALSLAVTLAVLGLGTAILVDLRADAWRQSEQAADNLIIALSRDIARTIKVYDLSIQGAIQALAEPALATADPVVRQLALFDTSATADYLGAMLIANAQGDVVANSLSLAFKPYNLAFREHFAAHQQRSDVGLFISRPIDGQIAREKIIVLTRRITNPDGGFGGIALGSLRLAYFQDLFSKLDLGAKGAATLLRTDGRVIMRRPFRPEDIDQDLGHAATFRKFLAAAHGHFVATATLDGVQRLYTFHHIDNLPLVLTVAIATEDIYARWWHKATSIGAILAVLCASSVVLCLLFRREIQRRLRALESLQQAAASLAVIAATDGLTGITNRRAYEASMAQEWPRAIRNDSPIAVLMLDVDCFKLYNDHYGHPAGDEVLKAIAGCLSTQVLRPADIAARYGGEEFVALLPDTGVEGALTVAEAVRSAVAALAIAHVHSPSGFISVSIGVAVARPAQGGTAAAMVKQADEALYDAKRSGRDRVILGAMAGVSPRAARSAAAIL